MELKLVLFMLCTFLGKSAAQLRCYACSYSSSDSDQSCLTITESTNTVNCPHEYCIIFRQEFVDPSGVVASFTRGCEQQPDFLNHEISDPIFRTFYRACTSDLCNIGNGIQSVTGGTLSATPENNGLNLLVPGTGASTHLQINALLTLVCIVILLS